MIRIQKSATADTRTCDFANTTKETLLASSAQHIGDVGQALAFFGALLTRQAVMHDTDKLTDIDGFHADFLTGFKQTGWWDRHRTLNRHHLNQADGIPADVNLIDVLDFIADCVMAGMARSGSVYPLQLPAELLERAFQNTVALLKREVVVAPEGQRTLCKGMTPFEMGGLVLEVQAPIFVFREWHRHRTQSYNELSARYTPLPDVNYIPSEERLMMGAGSNKQAQGTGAVLTPQAAAAFRSNLTHLYERLERDYQVALSQGVPKELARIHLPVGRYSRMRASANLRNWLAFLTLRMAPNAQWEIRQFANAVGELVAEKFPRTWNFFEEGRAR